MELKLAERCGPHARVRTHLELLPDRLVVVARIVLHLPLLAFGHPTIVAWGRPACSRAPRLLLPPPPELHRQTDPVFCPCCRNQHAGAKASPCKATDRDSTAESSHTSSSRHCCSDRSKIALVLRVEEAEAAAALGSAPPAVQCAVRRVSQCSWRCSRCCRWRRRHRAGRLRR